DVLALIVKYKNKKLENAIVVLVIDGLQNTISDINDRHNKNSSFYKTLTNIEDLSLKKPSCLSLLKPITVTHDSIIKDIFDINNSIIRLLVSNCAKQIVQAVLTHKLLNPYKPIEAKSTLTPDKVTYTGMFHFEKVGNSNYGFFTMPYIWLWIMNWDAYFGPFAGRAFIFAVKSSPNINAAGHVQLELVSQVSKIQAEQIITKRPFHNIQDAMNKTGFDFLDSTNAL
ncbi:6234_t:CDS:2, partial [Dentiscutata erythropus]